MELRILSADDVVRALPMEEAIAGMRDAYEQLSAGAATVPLRSRLPVPDRQGVILVMPAHLNDSENMAVKVVSVFPNNVTRQEPTIYATVLVLDAATGRPLGVIEGSRLTAIRTGAGSGAATDVLARSDASVVAILGSGVQARTQLEAVCTVRPIAAVRVYSPNQSHAHLFARQMAGREPVPASIRVVDTPSEAIRGANIICTATTSPTPVFDGRELEAGVHINAVGSYTADVQELDEETIVRSLLVVDSREAVLEESGDLIIPLQAGLIDEHHIHAELGEILGGWKPGRTDSQQITCFKSVGVAVQDVVAARIAMQKALALELGSVVEL